MISIPHSITYKLFILTKKAILSQLQTYIFLLLLTVYILFVRFNILQLSMKGQLPICNKVVFRRQFQRSNDMLSKRITKMKYSNFSALKLQEQNQNINKIRSVDLKYTQNHRKNYIIKTNDSHFKIRQENQILYNKLANQKSTLSSKTLAIQRRKNVQILNRIRKHPNKQTLNLRTQTSQLSYGLSQDSEANKLPRRQSVNFQLSQIESSMIDLKRHSIASKIQQYNKQQKSILLWSKAIQINKIYYYIKIIRLKTSYFIQVKPFSLAHLYHINLPQQLGTDLLTQNDYDYQYICHRCIKITQKRHLFSFSLKNIKHELTFQHTKLAYSESKEERISKQKIIIYKQNSNSTRTKQQISTIKYKDQTSCMIQETDQQCIDEDRLLDAINLDNINIDKNNKGK